MEKKLKSFERLLIIMDELRLKCPWDQKQTLESLRHLTIEETYELGDAIFNNDPEEIKGEIGDLFLHLVFYSKIASEKGWFDVADVLEKVCDKLVYRHPHIYGDVKVNSEEEVKANWEKLKLAEKTNNITKKSVLEGVPLSLPALVKASRIQSKVSGVGFDWENKNQVWEKIEEEMIELKDEVNKVSDNDNNHKRIEEEYGDLLFALVNYGRFINCNPEDTLEKANRKFISRFQSMEKLSEKQNVKFHDLTSKEMNELWNEVKIEEKKSANNNS